MRTWGPTLLACAMLPGCYLSHELGELDGGPVARRDAGPTDASSRDAASPDLGDIPCIPTTTAPRPIDVLFVVDDSPSMAEEQAQLAGQIPIFIHALATGDSNGDGVTDFPPVVDLHVGAITVNMGVAGIPNVPTCMRNADFGDDGILIDVPRLGGAGCMSSYPRFLSFVAGDDTARLATDFTCLARTGTMGCGFEQQLDATLKALVPEAAPYTFYAGTHGHGDDPATNGGFLRPDSVLAVLLITDEDDCSTDQTDIWNPASFIHTGDLNLRCINYFDQLYPVSRYVDGLRSLRPSAPADVVLLAIAGVPEDLVSGTSVDYARLFADPRMQNTIVVMGGTEALAPACSSPGRGIATPAVRIARVAEGLGESSLVQSICAGHYDLALGWLAGRAGARASCAAP